jgi:hypothetical protein
VATAPLPSAATLVFRHRRILPSAAGTVIEYGVPVSLFMKIVPDSAFSGRPPSAGGEKRGSRQVPVQAALGSIFALAAVSL